MARMQIVLGLVAVCFVVVAGLQQGASAQLFVLAAPKPSAPSASYGGIYEYAGAPTIKPTKSTPTKGTPTPKPTNGAPTPKPTMPPTTPQVQSDEVCVTDGGYVAQDSPCKGSWVYIAKGGKKTKLSGCVDVTGKYKPYVSPTEPPKNVTEGGNPAMWCPTANIYSPSKKDSQMEWGYCNCGFFGCLPSTVNAQTPSAVTFYQGLTKAQKQKFGILTQPASEFWVPLLTVHADNSAAPPCFTDGGLADENSPCMATWTYTFTNGTTTTVNGCASTTSMKPYTGGKVKQPLISSTSTSLYCSTVNGYSPAKSSPTKTEWGYCSCLSNLDNSAINTVLSLYNPLTLAERKKFWNLVKS